MPLTSERYFAVIDTETTWDNEVMSIGVVIADCLSFYPVKKAYFIIKPECKYGGMYSRVLEYDNISIDLKGTRKKVIDFLKKILESYSIESIFAYNASFDYNILPELDCYSWYDIIKVAAYKQYNKKIPHNAECFGTGKLKRNYGVEPMMKMLTGNSYYNEIHNAVYDAIDELKVMELLECTIDVYECAKIN